MSEHKIRFNSSDIHFKPAEKLTEKDWIDTSFAESKKAIGHLRLPGVDNGRYESRHPIVNRNGETIGYLSDAVSSIGYTWNCIYAANCFWITNMTFSVTLNGGQHSNVSLVDEVGTFLFSSTRKFKMIKTFDFDGHWAGFTKAFKLLDGERQLLYLTHKGFCIFDTYARNIISHINFPTYLSDYGFDFTISPKVKILALVGSSADYKDPIDGEYRYRNFIWLYNLETGSLIGENNLDIDTYVRWLIDFSEDGRHLRISSDSLVLKFGLATK